MPNTVLENDTEAVLAKAIEYGLGEGKTNFQVVVFSILNAVMLEVNIKDGIKGIRRTKVVPICKTTGMSYRNECDVDGEDSDEANATSLLEQVYRKHPGFISLQNFFSAAAKRRLSAFSQGRFPAEIYAMIIANADSSTRRACAKVSRIFYDFCQETFPFSNDLIVTKFEAFAQSAGSQNGKLQPWAYLDDLGIFTFQNQNTGHIMGSGHAGWHKFRRNEASIWCPIIGEVARPSMLIQIYLRVSLSLGHSKHRFARDPSRCRLGSRYRD